MIFVIIFGMIAVAVTSTLIQVQKDKTSVTENPKTSANTNPTAENTSTQKQVGTQELQEATLDLHGTFDQNDLMVKKVPIHYRCVSGDYSWFYQIEGLKDKSVENKINQEIEQKIKEAIDELIQDGESSIKDSYCYATLYGNFANVLSMEAHVTLYRKDDKTNTHPLTKDFSFNYELVHGNEIAFRDLFTQNADLESILKLAMHRIVMGYEVREIWGDYYTDIYFDTAKGIWLGKHHVYDNNTGRETETVEEYVPPYTEYEIEKIVKQFLKQENHKFAFSPNALHFKLGEEYATLYFTDMADSVTIYNKFLTTQSIFTRDDIGPKGIITCSAEELDGKAKYKESKFVSDNYYYDISFGGFSMMLSHYNLFDGTVNTDAFSDAFLEKWRITAMNEARKEAAKYQQIARDNPSKVYAVFIMPRVNPCHEGDGINSLCLVGQESVIYVCDSSQKEAMWDKIYDAYRYYNLSMWGSHVTSLINSEEMPAKEIKEENIQMINLKTGKEFENVASLFKNPASYETILNSKVEEELRKYPRSFQLGEYQVGDFGFEATNTLEEYNDISISFRDIQNDLVIDSMKENILPSSSEMITINMLYDLSNEELERAYYEPFARHGQDFQNETIKNYFSIWKWYEPSPGKTVSMEELTDLEQMNVNFMKRILEERNYF